MENPVYIKPNKEKWFKWMDEQDKKEKGGFKKYLKLKEMLRTK